MFACTRGSPQGAEYNLSFRYFKRISAYSFRLIIQGLKKLRVNAPVFWILFNSFLTDPTLTGETSIFEIFLCIINDRDF